MRAAIKMRGNVFGTCHVVREPGDPKFHGRINAAGESKFLHHLKGVLNAQGYDFIKKRMHKDGHMVDEMQQYLRERKPVHGRVLSIYNNSWAIEGAEVEFNQGEVFLGVTNIGKE
jgi:hypothetical protein